MDDAVRPSEAAFKAMYERGYCTWYNLYKMAVADAKIHWSEYLLDDKDALLNYPSFPENLAVDTSFSSVALVRAKSTWRTAEQPCDLPSFDQDFCIPVASKNPVIVTISDPQHGHFSSSQCFSEDEYHTTLLILAWTYILSARWAEIIPGANGPQYTDYVAEWKQDNTTSGKASTASSTAINLGDIDDDAARWWAAVLALEGGWVASIRNDSGGIFHSPWHTKVETKQRYTLSCSNSRPLPPQHCAASFSSSLRYLSSYCKFHKIADQGDAALAATLLLPVAGYDYRIVQLRAPRVRRKERSSKQPIPKTRDWSENLTQLDRLLALSCNAVGTKSLLTSVFFELGVACNLCGAWLQGIFAFLDSDIVQDQDILLRILIKRDPSLAFLWLGAFVIGSYKRSLQEARRAWWRIDLNAAAWTGTLMSFIQESASKLAPDTEEISRADECRLMYLSHDQSYTIPPLLPFEPFGSTAISDTNIDIRPHIRCQPNHHLEYESLTWHCLDGQRAAPIIPKIPLRVKNGHPAKGNISINYEKLEYADDENSEMVTQNIFTWLRGEDGFPVVEKAIREHEWIDNLDSDDDDLITGDARSTAGGNLHGWLLRTMTKRSNSI